jgi:hypothetical protein
MGHRGWTCFLVTLLAGSAHAGMMVGDYPGLPQDLGIHCRALYEALLCRDYSDPTYFRSHRLLVDIYALQHPERFCRSGKSAAAHIVGVHVFIEGGEEPDVGVSALTKWLDGPSAISKPTRPASRGILTIQHVIDLDGEEYRDALHQWALSTWAAYSGLHLIARNWLGEAHGASSHVLVRHI